MTLSLRLTLPAILISAALGFAAPAFAAGSNDSSEPKETETTKTCKKGEVWDEAKKACVKIEDSRLEDDTYYDNARELAYAGRYEDALAVLDRMAEGDSDRVLTYKGFATRKMGDMEKGLAYYNQAIALNPDNFLARSYLGQAYVELGRKDDAKAELDQIASRGGADTWPWEALDIAIRTGKIAEF
ncbi:MAG: tetratricopeptide repeat protein [Paracoccaceae bacterium]